MELRSAILSGASSAELKQLALTGGMQTLEQSAIKKILAGVTTVEEMHRVLMTDL
jgi:type II secretory ATPase GspE/PulE/Tfp pilus assembly ATPase PilB-like protein